MAENVGHVDVLAGSHGSENLNVHRFEKLSHELAGQDGQQRARGLHALVAHIVDVVGRDFSQIRAQQLAHRDSHELRFVSAVGSAVRQDFLGKNVVHVLDSALAHFFSRSAHADGVHELLGSLVLALVSVQHAFGQKRQRVARSASQDHVSHVFALSDAQQVKTHGQRDVGFHKGNHDRHRRHHVRFFARDVNLQSGRGPDLVRVVAADFAAHGKTARFFDVQHVREIALCALLRDDGLVETIDDESARRLDGLVVVVADDRADHGGHFHNQHVVQDFALFEHVHFGVRGVCREHVVMHVGEHVRDVRLAPRARLADAELPHAAVGFRDDRFADRHVGQVHVVAETLARAEHVHAVVEQHRRDLVSHVVLVRLRVVRHVPVRVHETVDDFLGRPIVAHFLGKLFSNLKKSTNQLPDLSKILQKNSGFYFSMRCKVSCDECDRQRNPEYDKCYFECG